MVSPSPGRTKARYQPASRTNHNDLGGIDRETLDHQVSLMSSTSPGHTKASFEPAIRKMNEEMSLLRQVNFHLNLKLHQLQNQVASYSSPRSPGAPPKPDNFYDFTGDEQEPSAHPATPLEDNHPTTATLLTKINDLCQERDELTANNNRLNEILDDLREKAIMEREEAKNKLKTQHIELQTLANQGEDLQSEKIQLQLQIAGAKEEIEDIRKEANDAKSKIEVGEHRERALRTRAEGYKMQYNAAVAAMNAEKKRAREASEKVGLGNVEILELRKKLEDKASEVDKLQRGVFAATKERDSMKEGLQRERERAGIWQDTEKLVKQGEMLLEGSAAMESMLHVLNTQTTKYNQLQYDPNWRDMMVADLNECLRVLYQSQREVEAKRQIVIDKYCAGNFAQEGTTTPSIS